MTRAVRLNIFLFTLSTLLFSNFARAAVVISDGSVKALYHLEDTSDSSGNGYHLTNNNGVTFEAGKLGMKAANGGSDNTNKYLSVANNLGINGGAISISAWFKMTGTVATNAQQVVATHTAAASPHIVEQIGVWNDVGDKKAFTYRAYDQVQGYYATYSTSFDDGSWHHLVLTFDGSSLVNWYDGVQRAVVNIPAGTGFPGLTDSFDIMAWANVAFFQGMIDEVVVLNRVLTNAEISSLWNFGEGAEVVIGPVTLGEQAANLAAMLETGEYLFGGKGWERLDKRYLDVSEIFSPYHYYTPNPNDTPQACKPIIDPDMGVDCSGLVMWSYNKAFDAKNYRCISGIASHHECINGEENPVFMEGADGQFTYNVQPIQKLDLKPGDLLFFDYAPKSKLNPCVDYFDSERVLIDHVAMYIGNGKLIEAKDCPTYSNGGGIRKSDFQDNPNVEDPRESALNDSGKRVFCGYGRVILPQIDGKIVSLSPVSLLVTDPDGIEINENTTIATDEEFLREIPRIMYYSQWDTDGDGDLEDMVSIPRLKNGPYVIKAVPKPDAVPEDLYSVLADIRGEIVTLVQDNSVDSIPPEGYGILVDDGLPIPFTPVAVDVRPGEMPNVINHKSNGVVPVAVLSNSSFDATMIDPLSVRFGPGAASEAHNKGHIEDANDDGIEDLVLHFRIKETDLNVGDTKVVLEGSTFTGMLIRGTDNVVIK